MAFPFFSRKVEVIGSDAPDAFGLGRYVDEATGRIGPKLQMGGTEPIVIVGRNRSGKDAGIGTSNLLRLMSTSCFWVDPRAEAAAIAGAYRRTLGPTKNINPFGVLANDLPDVASDGVSTVAGLRRDDPLLFDRCMAISEAMIKTDEKNPHFTYRARELFTGLLMVEVMEADAGKAVLANVRARLTEPEVLDPNTKEPLQGLAATAIKWSNAGNPQIAGLLNGFTSLDGDEVRDVIATADAATLCLLSNPIRDDELKAGFDFNELGERPTTVFLSAPHELFQPDSIHAPYMRLILSSALRSLYRPTKTPCIFYVNEMAAFGRLGALEASIGLVAGYGIRLVLVVQSFSQLREIYRAWLGKFSWQRGGGGPGRRSGRCFYCRLYFETFGRKNAHSAECQHQSQSGRHRRAKRRSLHTAAMLDADGFVRTPARLRLCLGRGTERPNPHLLSRLIGMSISCEKEVGEILTISG